MEARNGQHGMGQQDFSMSPLQPENPTTHKDARSAYGTQEWDASATNHANKDPISDASRLIDSDTSYHHTPSPADKVPSHLIRPVARLTPFLCLVPTTIISLLLLAGNKRQWTVPDNVVHFIDNNLSVVQAVTQVIANILGFFTMFVICKLLHYFSRLQLLGKFVSIDGIRLYTGLLNRSMNTDIPFGYLILLGLFISAGMAPSAIWAGAIAPISVTRTQNDAISIPSYENIDMLSYDWSSRDGLNASQTNRGYFTYNVGEHYMGRLMEAAAESTTVDNSSRLHTKLDNTGFVYIGRSFGVGASAGLVDDSLRQNTLAQKYSYQEMGYRATVACIRNLTNSYHLRCDGDGSTDICWAVGSLPNSVPGTTEGAAYAWGGDNTVAMGVVTNPDVPRKIVAMTTGINYVALNNTQCEWTFEPTAFTVSVSLDSKNITVTSDSAAAVTDIEPSGMLSFLANWQYTLISSDQTSRYTSLLGSSIYTNIVNYELSQGVQNVDATSNETSILRGLEQSLEGMMDDMLACYASAQLVVAKVQTSEACQVTVRAIGLGQEAWIITVVVLNLLVLALTVFEGFRTHLWGKLEKFDYLDPAHLFIGAANAQGWSNHALAPDNIKLWSVKQDGWAFLMGSKG